MLNSNALLSGEQRYYGFSSDPYYHCYIFNNYLDKNIVAIQDESHQEILSALDFKVITGGLFYSFKDGYFGISTNCSDYLQTSLPLHSGNLRYQDSIGEIILGLYQGENKFELFWSSDLFQTYNSKVLNLAGRNICFSKTDEHILIYFTAEQILYTIDGKGNLHFKHFSAVPEICSIVGYHKGKLFYSHLDKLFISNGKDISEIDNLNFYLAKQIQDSIYYMNSNVVDEVGMEYIISRYNINTGIISEVYKIEAGEEMVLSPRQVVSDYDNLAFLLVKPSETANTIININLNSNEILRTDDLDIYLLYEYAYPNYIKHYIMCLNENEAYLATLIKEKKYIITNTSESDLPRIISTPVNTKLLSLKIYENDCSQLGLIRSNRYQEEGNYFANKFYKKIFVPPFETIDIYCNNYTSIYTYLESPVLILLQFK
ncbi:MAG: hypothetical protein FJ216_07410 [Ignavibacteria bacterium]|nr:hypothetical protein [Ignavibacteria bacterium]